VDGKKGTAEKWFSLFDNKLDGSYHLPDADSSIGWWGNVLSNPDGSFNSPQKIAVLFPARPVDKLQVYGDDVNICYPVDFDINLYSGTIVLYTQQVRGNSNVSYLKPINIVGNVTKYEIVIYKLNKQSVCKITECYSIVSQVYYNDTLVDMHLLEELAYEDSSIPLGAISSNEIDITFNNDDRRFDLSNVDSPLYGMLRRNRKVTAWLGAKVKGDDIEWHKLGVFWSTTWKAPFSEVNAYLTARDLLELLRNDTFTTSQLYVNYNLYQLFELVLTTYGLNSTQYYIDPLLKDIVLPYAWFERITYREAFG
jgi:hypothetical protein